MSALRIRDVRLLVGAVGLSALGDVVVAIPLALRAGEHGALAVSAFFVCLWGPLVLLGGAAGVAVDRFENRRLLIVVSLAQAAIALGLLTAQDSLAWLLALTALLGSAAAIAQPAEFALLPEAAGPERIAEANGHVEASRYLGMTAGPLLGGLAAASGLVDLALVFDAASFLVVAGVAIALRARRQPRGATGDRLRARDGVAFLLRDGVLAVAMTAAVASLLFFTISATAELFYATDVLGAGKAGYGLLITAWTLGMVTGAVGLARRVPARALAGGALLAVAVQGAGLAGAAAVGVLGIALAGFVLGGVAHGVKNVLFRTLIHTRVPEALRGRAFAAYNAARNGAEIGALALGGVLVGLIGARAALALSGAIPLAIGLLALLIVNRGRATTAATTPRRTGYAHLES
jgi:Na+/melibiose symporter-like transporter